MARFGRRIDLACAIVGLIVLLSFLPLVILRGFNPIYIVVVSIGLVCITLYIVLRKSLRIDETQTHSRWSPYLSGILYTLAIVAFLIRSNQYEKPLSYYVLITLAVVFALWGVLKGKCHVSLLLVFSVIIGLTHIWTEHLMFPNSLIGIDPWQHMRTTMQGADSVGLSGYTLGATTIGGSFSLMHIYLKWIMDVTGLDYKWASLIFVGSLQTIGNIILAYLVGKELLNHKVGVVAALMIANANWAIFFGEWIIPNGIGATLSLIVAYLFIKAYRTKKYWITLLAVLCLPLALLTHVVAAAWVVGTIVCLSIVMLILEVSQSKKVNTYYIIGYPIVVVATFFTWYQFAVLNILSCVTAQQVDSSFGNVVPTAIMPDISPVIIPPITTDIPVLPTVIPSDLIPAAQNYLGTSLGEMTIDSMGMFLYFGIALIGMLIMLKHTNLNKAWAVLCIGTLAIGFVPLLLGVTLLEHRWWYLAEVFMSIPLAFALVSFAGKWRVAVVWVVGIVVFTSIIGFPSNMTNRTLSPNLIVRYAFTERELAGLKIAELYSPNILGADPIYLGYARTEYRGQLEYLDKYILTGNFTTCGADVILLRDALYKEPFGYGSGAIYNLAFNPVDIAIKQGYRDAWSNGEIHVLVRE